MKRSVTKKQLGHCSKCGECLYDHGEQITSHSCDPQILKQMESATDAAFTRDPEPRTRQSFADRLSSGFAMLDDDYEPE